MPRSKGSRNADFEASRSELLARLRAALFRGGPPPSFRGLAEGAGVTIPTLRHYFGGREEVIAAVLADCHAGAREHLEAAGTPAGGFRDSVHEVARYIADGFRHGGLDRLHAVGLAEGVAHPRAAQAYLADVLEPTLRAVQRRLEAHVARGEMRPADTRHAALALVSPILVLTLHQTTLGGAAAYPTDIDRFVTDHAEAFVLAHAAPAPS